MKKLSPKKPSSSLKKQVARAPSRVQSTRGSGESSRSVTSKTSFVKYSQNKDSAPGSFKKTPYNGKESFFKEGTPRTENKKSIYTARVPYTRTIPQSQQKSLKPKAYGSNYTSSQSTDARQRHISKKDSAKSPAGVRPGRSSRHDSAESPAGSGNFRRTPASLDTSWGKVADWYNKHLETGDDTYHTKIVFPGVTRMLGDVSGKKVLDMACGQGIFSEKLRDSGALVTGVDLGKQLIKIAEEKSLSVKEKGTHKVIYHTASSDDMYMLKDNSFDVVVCILALQNIENLQKTINEASRVLAPAGTFLFVLNHPSFRNPRKTMWGFNEADDTQYRRVDEYMSESNLKVDMTPGSFKDKKFTVSFHRPLQIYIKALSKSGFAVTRLEEWISHKESERGPKKRAEDTSRKEIPMFMCIEAQKTVISD